MSSKRKQFGLSLIAIVSIIAFVAIGLSWDDSFWSCISFSTLFVLAGLLSLVLVKNRIAGGYAAFLMFNSGLYILQLSSNVSFLLFILAMLASLSGLLIGVVGAFFYPGVRKGFLQLLGMSILVVPVFFAINCAQDHITDTALEARSRSLAPLVKAIEAYQDQKGFPPNSLHDLVPGYLISVCNFEGPGNDITYELKHGAWQLCADCTNGLTTFDKIYYRRSHDYSDLIGSKFGGGFFASYGGP